MFFKAYRAEIASYEPLPVVPRTLEEIPPPQRYYAERNETARMAFWKNPGILSRDTLSSFYGFAHDVIDIKACLDDENMQELMLRTW